MRVRYKIKEFKLEPGQILYFKGNTGQSLQYCVFRVDEIQQGGKVILSTHGGGRIPHTEKDMASWRTRWRLATKDEQKYFNDAASNR